MTITALSKADHADQNHPRWREHMQSVGVPRTDVEVRVVDDGREIPVGQAGEVVVRGDVVMTGYWNQPDATADALRDGWLCTGDIGSFDADGYLTLRDRSKDLIISGGRRRRRAARREMGRGGRQARTARPAPGRSGRRRVALRLDLGRAAAKLAGDAEFSHHEETVP